MRQNEGWQSGKKQRQTLSSNEEEYKQTPRQRQMMMALRIPTIY